MVYLKIGKSRFAIGLQWLEILASITESKSEVAKNVENAFKEQSDANFGIKLVSEDESIYSVGVLPGHRKPLSFPRVYSLASAVTENLSSGIVFLNIKPEQIDDSFPLEMTEEMDLYLKSTLGSNRILEQDFWWGCAIQNGVVISDGEYIGDEKGLAEFVLNSMMIDESIKVFGVPSDKISTFLSDVKFNSIDIDLLTEGLTYKSRVSQVIGIPVVKSLYVGLALVAILGVYQVSDMILNQEDVQSAYREVRTAIPMPSNKPSEALKIKEDLYLSEVKSNIETSLKRMDFSAFSDVLSKYNNGYTYGWRFTEAFCDTDSCKVKFTPDGLNDLDGFIKHYGFDYKALKIDDSANSVIVTDTFLEPPKLPMDLSIGSIKSFFLNFPDSGEYNYKLILKSIELSGESKVFQWASKGLVSTEFKSIHPDPSYPIGYKKGGFGIKSTDISHAQMIFNAYTNFEQVRLISTKIEADKAGGIAYAMNFEYLAQ